MSAHTATWECGTTKTLNNAFTWRKEPVVVPPSRIKGTPEQLKERKRLDRRNELRRMQRAAERGNKEVSLQSFIPNSTKAPR